MKRRNRLYLYPKPAREHYLGKQVYVACKEPGTYMVIVERGKPDIHKVDGQEIDLLPFYTYAILPSELHEFTARTLGIEGAFIVLGEVKA